MVPEQHAFSGAKDQLFKQTEGLKTAPKSKLFEWIEGKTKLSDCVTLTTLCLSFDLLLNIGPMLLWIQVYLSFF